jgi:hypothetical protein
MLLSHSSLVGLWLLVPNMEVLKLLSYYSHHKKASGKTASLDIL